MSGSLHRRLFPGLQGIYDKFIWKCGSKTTTQKRNKQNRASKAPVCGFSQCVKFMVLEHLQESVDVDFSDFLDGCSLSLPITGQGIQQKEKYPFQSSTSKKSLTMSVENIGNSLRKKIIQLNSSKLNRRLKQGNHRWDYSMKYSESWQK